MITALFCYSVLQTKEKTVVCGLSSDLKFWRVFFVCFERPRISAFSHLLDSVCSECWKYIDSSQKSLLPQLTGMCFQQTHNSAYKFSKRGPADCSSLRKPFPHGVLLTHSKYTFRNHGILCFPTLSPSYY